MQGAGNRAIASLLRPATVQRDAPASPAGPKSDTASDATGGGTAAGPPVARPTLRRGSSGDDVRYVQTVLTAQGWNVSVDGQFDAQTAAYVCLFQHRWHIDVDGSVGRDTWAALDAEIEPGGNDRQSAVADAAAAVSGGPGPSTEFATSAAADAAKGNPPAVQRQEAGDAAGTSSGKRAAVTTVGPGSIGSVVMLVQAGLQMRFGSAGIAADGIFGDSTLAYVLLYQHDHGLTTDGIVGPETRVRLDPMLSMQRHLAASEELSSLVGDLQAMNQDQLASALPTLIPRIQAAMRTLGQQDD
jgi:peptidoglycan hydrolase-like protein with peptidoglycan-binding domain